MLTISTTLAILVAKLLPVSVTPVENFTLIGIKVKKVTFSLGQAS